MSFELSTPVALLVFNRPDTTHAVFDAVRRARPTQLFLIADGPRESAEAEACSEVRRIVDAVDWPCDVRRNYAPTNMGIRRRVTNGLNWLFDQTDRAIVLEDDCLPNPTFFRFCQELLCRYRDHPNVMMISGDNFLLDALSVSDSYYFSRYAHIWGWATWRRAWESFDPALSRWRNPANQRRFLEQFSRKGERAFWRYTLNRVANGRCDSWAFAWAFTLLSQQGLSATPNRNLVTNVGFGGSATHTRRPRLTACLATHPMRFPLRHPSLIQRHREADRLSANNALLNPPTGNRLLDAARAVAKSVWWSLRA